MPASWGAWGMAELCVCLAQRERAREAPRARGCDLAGVPGSHRPEIGGKGTSASCHRGLRKSRRNGGPKELHKMQVVVKLDS